MRGMNGSMERVGNALCLDFANTVNTRPDPVRDWLSTGEELLAWASEAGLCLRRASPDETTTALADLRSLREAIYDAFAAIAAGAAPPSDELAVITRAYAAALPHANWRREHSRLVPEWPPPQRAPEIAWHVTTSAVDLLRQGPLERVGSCPSCRWLFLDTSRNGQRRWCSMATCGSRTKSARYFARTRRAADTRPG